MFSVIYMGFRKGKFLLLSCNNIWYEISGEWCLFNTKKRQTQLLYRSSSMLNCYLYKKLSILELKIVILQCKLLFK